MAALNDNAEKTWDIKILKGAGLVSKKHVDVIITEFKNNFFIIATEYGKIGVMVEVTQIPLSKIGSSVINSKVLFGNDSPEVHAAACSLVKMLKLKKTVLFGLAFKEYTETSVADLTDVISKVLEQKKADA